MTLVIEAGPQHKAVLDWLDRNRELEWLIESAKQIEALLCHPGWAIVQGLVDERVKANRTQLEWHGVRDPAEYASLLGVIRGLATQKACAEAVLIAAGRAERELERRAAQAALEEPDDV